MSEDLGEARLRLTTDETGLDKGLDQSEAKTRSFLDRVKATTGAVYKTVAVGAATALAAMTAQGVKLNQVLNDLQAETGATGDEWAAMEAVVRRENGRTTESIEDISAATKAMREDLNLSGADMEKYADRFFDAALVTKKSGEQIVQTTDDIADGYGVNVDRALGSIDQIIASQQKWGGSLQERIDILPTLAKGLKGLNGTIDDGIALLNLASASGLSYANVQQAINSAVARFAVPPTLAEIIGLQDVHKSAVERAKDEVLKLEAALAEFVVPDRLREIVKTLDAIEDPTQRAAIAERIYNEEVAKFNADPIARYLDILGAIPDAQARTTRAIELFGPKAGPIWAQLAGAVHDAGGSLEDFNVTQEAAGDKATEVARQIDAGPIRSLKLLGEKIGAMFADAGSSPFITGFAALGTILAGFAPNLSGKLAGGLGRGIAGGFRLAAKLPFVAAAVAFAADQAATVYLKVLMAGDFVSGALRGAWARVAGSAAVTAIVTRAGSAAATAYLATLIAGDAIGVALQGAWAASGGRMLAAAGVSGTAAGAAFAAAAALAIVGLVAVVTVKLVFDYVDLQKQNVELLNRVGEGAASASVEGLKAFRDQLAAALEKEHGNFDPIEDFFGLSQQNNLQRQLDAIDSMIAAGLGTPQTQAAVEAAGTQTGEKYGDAVVEAANRSVVEQSMAVVNGFSAWMETTGKDWVRIAKELSTATAAATAQGLLSKRDAVNDAWQALVSGMQGAITPAKERGQLLGQLASKALRDGLASGDPAVAAQATATKMAIEDRLSELNKTLPPIGKDAMAALTKGWAAEGRATANRAAGAVAQGILEKRDAVDQAWTTLLDMIKNSQSKTGQIARLTGQLASKELAKGLKDRDPAVRAQAAYTKQLILDQLAELAPRAGTLSKKAWANLSRAMKSADPDIRAAATAIYAAAKKPIEKLPGAAKAAGAAAGRNLKVGLGIHKTDVADEAAAIARKVTTPLSALPGKATTYGERVGAGIVSGLTSAKLKIEGIIGTIARIISDFLRTHSPAKRGPLSEGGGPEAWGQQFATLLARGMGSGVATMTEMSRALADAAMPDLRLPRLTDGLALAGAGALGPGPTFGGRMANAERRQPGERSAPLIGTLNVYPGNDVSPARARQFGQSVLDEVARGFQEQDARIGSGRRVRS